MADILCKIPQLTGITVTDVLEGNTVACSKGESIAFKPFRMDISFDVSGINPVYHLKGAILTGWTLLFRTIWIAILSLSKYCIRKCATVEQRNNALTLFRNGWFHVLGYQTILDCQIN